MENDFDTWKWKAGEDCTKGIEWTKIVENAANGVVIWVEKGCEASGIDFLATCVFVNVII